MLPAALTEFVSRLPYAAVLVGLVLPLAANPLRVSAPVVPEAQRPGVSYIEVPAVARTGRTVCNEDLPPPAVAAVPEAAVCE